MGAKGKVSALMALVVCTACNICTAAEPQPSLDDVLAKWEAATAKIKTLDAKVYRWKYDAVFDPPKKQPPAEVGRFYCEAEKVGCLQIKSATGAGWNGLEEMIAWRQKDTLLIDGKRRTCIKLVWPDAKVPESQPQTAFSFLSLLQQLQYPKTLLPLTVGVRADDLRKRFRMEVAVQGNQYLITCVPKTGADAASYSCIEVLVDTKTYLTAAVEITAANHKDRTAWMLECPKINERPADRAQLLTPDLKGLTVIE